MPALQYNVFIHDVDKLISLNSQLLMSKGGWGEGGVSCSPLLISLNSQLLMSKGGWGGVGWGGVSCSSLLISLNPFAYCYKPHIHTDAFLAYYLYVHKYIYTSILMYPCMYVSIYLHLCIDVT